MSELTDSLGPFEFVQIEMPERTPKDIKRMTPGASYQAIQSAHAHLKRCEHYVSRDYHVAVDKETEHGFPFDAEAGEAIWHLSIKRHDKEPMQDWRVMQRIKTEIAGAETEAFELYPAESRVVDTANQYHLYAFVGCGTIPVGFPGGARSDLEQVNAEGGKSKQRPGSGGNTADHWQGKELK